MNLKDKSIVEKKELTSHWPVLLVGANSSGKTTALENMSKEDKARTVVLNFDTKPLNQSNGEFAATFAVAGTKETLEAQLQTLPKEADDYRKHLTKILKSSYFLDDPEVIDKIVNHINKAAYSPNVDRVVVDSFTALIDFVESWANTNFSGRTVWSNYGFGTQRILQALRECTLHGCKYVYVYAHHPFIPAIQYDTTPKEAIAVKGGILKNNIETGYNTIVFTHLTEDGKRMFECDNLNTLDTSRTKLVNDSFKFERHSLDDLEQLLAGKAEVVDEKIMLK